MKITKIQIDNFRSIESLHFEPKEGLNIIVGENGVGKSNILLAIEKVFAAVKVGTGLVELDRRIGAESLGTSIRVEVSLDDLSYSEILKVLVSGQVDLGDEAKVLDRLKALLDQSLELCIQWDSTGQTHYIKFGPLFILGKFISNKVRRGGTTGQWSSALSIIFNTGLEGAMSADLYELANIEETIGGVIEQRFRLFNEFRARPVSSGRGSGLDAVTGSETAGVLLNLKNSVSVEQRRRYGNIQESLTSILPAFAIEVVETTAGGNADVTFTAISTNHVLPLSNVSAGTGELLTWSTNIVDRQHYVFALENPELHLHPHHQRALLRRINESSVDNQIFMVTHSPFMVEPSFLENLSRVALKEDCTAIDNYPSAINPRAAAALKEAFRDAGKREMLFARAVLLVEDETQRAFLGSLAPRIGKDLDTYSITLASVDGEDGYAPYIALLEALDIAFKCLRDKGPGGSSPEHQHAFTFLGKEIEDFLMDEGFGDLMLEAKTASGKNKTRIGRYLGEHMPVNQVPEIFTRLLDEVIDVAS